MELLFLPSSFFLSLCLVYLIHQSNQSPISTYTRCCVFDLDDTDSDLRLASEPTYLLTP